MSDFWPGQRVFLTRPPVRPSLFGNAEAGMELILADVTNYDGLISTPLSAVPDIVIHIAAQPLLRYHANRCETYCTNVIRAVHLLQAVRQVKSVRAVLNITSDKRYQNCEWVSGCREKDRLGGDDPDSTMAMDLRDFLESIYEHWGHRRKLRYSDGPLTVSKPPALDCTDARKLLERRAAWKTERVTAQTGRWYRDLHDTPSSTSKITAAQINSWHAEL